MLCLPLKESMRWHRRRFEGFHAIGPSSVAWRVMGASFHQALYVDLLFLFSAGFRFDTEFLPRITNLDTIMYSELGHFFPPSMLPRPLLLCF